MKSEKIIEEGESILKKPLVPSPCPLAPSLTCPICDQRFDENDDGVAMPFCSSRCKLIDAARWLDERYGMPIEKPLEDDFADGE